ncbi:neutral/alkaline non-lysosomal ceramidase N-terminal domain-containing protein, partial [Pirellulaceae bacterium]|nr:neutral/alkaline non-lysosomal ceramidase N-terminal domain-containing protein [Pirellulaceae bacterium]
MKSFTLSFNSPLLRGHHTDKFVVPRRRKLFSCFSFFVSLAFFLSATATAIQINTIDIGVAKIDVTPTTPVVLAGYGSRNTPYDSIDGQLWARALVIGRSKPVAVVVLDNCGVPKAISALVKKQLRDTGLTDDRILVAATHTHNAPTL